LDELENEYREAKNAFNEAKEKARPLQSRLSTLDREKQKLIQEKVKSVNEATERARTDRQSLSEAVKYFGVNDSLTDLLSSIANFEAVSDHGSNVHSKLVSFFDQVTNNLEGLLEALEEQEISEWELETRLESMKNPETQPFLDDKNPGLLLKY